MLLQFNVLPATKCPKKDVIAALEIYCKTVDSGSMTDTNQIKDYIWNPKKHINEKRKMFFYLMYNQDHKVIGFSEYAYLPDTQVLVLDYLCTLQRNHMLFYNFYHMALSEITTELKNKGLFILYIITELSLHQKEGKLIDVDSNYFRHLLSNENYKLLKYPYYQPPLLKHEDAEEFNIAIKLLYSDNNNFYLSKEQYILIIEELYMSHYYEWFDSNDEYLKILQHLLHRIKNEFSKNKNSNDIALVQCHLFENGQCPKFTAENITIPRERKKKIKAWILILLWGILSIVTLIFCVTPKFNKIITSICSFFTIITGLNFVISFRYEIFSSK